MTAFSRISPRIILWLLIFPLAISCSSNNNSQTEGSSQQEDVATFDPGELTETVYRNSFLNLELPIVSGWETGDHNMVVKSLENWDPDSGIHTIPSVFLLTAGAPQTDEIQKIVTQYFLQIESTTLYPEFNADPDAYLSAVGEALVTQAGQTVEAAPHIERLGNRQVHRMDIAFTFGNTPGKQSYFSWVDKGVFVNLVFTYGSDEEWNLLSSQVIDPIILD